MCHCSVSSAPPLADLGGRALPRRQWHPVGTALARGLIGPLPRDVETHRRRPDNSPSTAGFPMQPPHPIGEVLYVRPSSLGGWCTRHRHTGPSPQDGRWRCVRASEARATRDAIVAFDRTRILGSTRLVVAHLGSVGPGAGHLHRLRTVPAAEAGVHAAHLTLAGMCGLCLLAHDRRSGFRAL